MAKRLFVFNPDCELAIANESPYYMPPASIAQMASDLAYLPAYLAEEGDFVLVPELPCGEFRELRERVMGYVCRPVTEEETGRVCPEKLEPWGWSPRLCHQAAGLNLSGEWEEGKKALYSRRKAQEVLREMTDSLPFVEGYIVPDICHSIPEIEQKITEGGYIVKAPWSSSGKGLLFLQNTVLTKEKQWISGVLRKQKYVMLEKHLDKVFDFAMEFYSDLQGKVTFIGFSAFSTGQNGEYRGNYIGPQENIEKRLYDYIGKDVLQQVKQKLTGILESAVAKAYAGYFGVDMMIYRNVHDQYCIQPCVEINMRYNMGILALEISRKCLSLPATGFFTISYYPASGEALNAHLQKQLEKPLVIQNKRIKSGYFNLTPVNENTRFVAGVEVE